MILCDVMWLLKLGQKSNTTSACLWICLPLEPSHHGVGCPNLSRPWEKYTYTFSGWPPAQSPASTPRWRHLKMIITALRCVLSHFSCVRLFATLWTVARQAPLSRDSSGNLPDPGIKPSSSALAGRFSTVEPAGKPSQWSSGWSGTRSVRITGNLVKGNFLGGFCLNKPPAVLTTAHALRWNAHQELLSLDSVIYQRLLWGAGSID